MGVTDFFERRMAAISREPGPVTFEYAHSREKAPDMGEMYGQHIEPHGRYMVERGPGHRGDRWEIGTTTFQNPLHLDWNDGNWKRTLSEAHGGKTGAELSRALLAKGHDGIITHETYRGKSYPSEIVDLRPLHRQSVRQREGDTRSHGEYELRYRTKDISDDSPTDGKHVIEAFHPDEEAPVGRMTWGSSRNPNRIQGVDVHPDHRRSGLATAMWNWGQEMTPRPKHSDERTDSGDAWARSVGGPLPRRRTAGRGDGRAPCGCCGGSGEHDTGRECYRCDGSGYPEGDEVNEPIPCAGARPLGMDNEGHQVELDPLDGWQHLDGSVSHDDGTTVSDHPVKTAGARGGLPEGITFEHKTPTRGLHTLYARHPDAPENKDYGPHLGRMAWWDNGEIANVAVHPDYQRRGLASELFRRAKQITPDLHHSDILTDEGDAWAKKTANSDGDDYVTCDQGHEHWGTNGAAGMLIRHTDDAGTRRYLLQKRAPWVDHGDTWGIPGGALGGSESPEEGARRETEEELGRLPRDLRHSHTVTDDHGGWAYRTVIADSPHQFTPAGGVDAHESQGHGWFTADEVQGLPLHPGFKKTWDTVRRSRTDKAAAADFLPSSRIFGPTYGLDHRLFDGRHLRPEVRQAVLRRLDSVLRPLLGPDWQNFVEVYLAGSEASEWTGPNLEGNNDFDTLLGVNYDAARHRAPGLAGNEDNADIDAWLNKALHAEYNAEPWHTPFGDYSLTGYVNPNAYDIRAIKPYAAYDISDDRWAVEPPHLPSWSLESFPQGHALIEEGEAVSAYVKAILEMPEPYRTQQGAALYDFLHSDRSRAFGPNGEGWYDSGNVLEKWLDQEGLWAQLVRLKHNANQGTYDEGYVPQEWSNTPRMAALDLYHRTTPEKAEAIAREKRMTSKETHPAHPGGVAFFSTHPHGEATGYGEGLVHVRVPEDLAELDDEFPGGEQHYAVPVRRLKPEHFVTTAVYDPQSHAWKPDPQGPHEVFSEREAHTPVAKQIIRDKHRQDEDADYVWHDLHPTARQRVRKQITDRANEDPIIVGVNRPALHDLLHDGRLKTLHEFHKEISAKAGPYGMDDRHDHLHPMYFTGRHAYEKHVMGIGDDVKPEHRPIYGSVTEAPENNPYGNYQIELKPHVRNRTTVTMGDSFTSKRRPYPINDVHRLDDDQLTAMTDADEMHHLNVNGHPKTYMEAQVHGGITPHDVQAVHFYHDPDERDHELMEHARKHGIEVHHHDEGREPLGDLDSDKIGMG